MIKVPEDECKTLTDEGRRMTEAKPQRMTMVLFGDDEIEEAYSPGGRRHTDEHGDDC